MLERLSADPKLRGKKFTLSVQIWIEPDGRIKTVRLVGGTSDRELDGDVSAALASLGRMDQAPPIEMPQPINLKIVSRS